MDKHEYYKSKDGSYYDLDELSEMISNQSKYKEFFNYLPENIFDLLPDDVKVELFINHPKRNYLKFKREFIASLPNPDKLLPDSGTRQNR